MMLMRMRSFIINSLIISTSMPIIIIVMNIKDNLILKTIQPPSFLSKGLKILNIPSRTKFKALYPRTYIISNILILFPLRTNQERRVRTLIRIKTYINSTNRTQVAPYKSRDSRIKQRSILRKTILNSKQINPIILKRRDSASSQK